MIEARTRKRSDPSPFALNSLPVELLAIVLQHLDSRNLKSARLVCRNWEQISRPDFARRHLCRTVFWITSSSLRELDGLSRKYGTYMKTVYITSTHFSGSGLLHLFKNYLRDRRATFKHSRYDSTTGNRIYESATILQVKTHHLATYFRKQGWQYDRSWLTNVRFFWHYMRSILSQRWLRISGQDRAKMATALKRIPGCKLEVVNTECEVGQLQYNNRIYGKPAPKRAFELALFSREGNSVDGAYSAHLLQVVEDIRSQLS